MCLAETSCLSRPRVVYLLTRCAVPVSRLGGILWLYATFAYTGIACRGACCIFAFLNRRRRVISHSRNNQRRFRYPFQHTSSPSFRQRKTPSPEPTRGHSSSDHPEDHRARLFRGRRISPLQDSRVRSDVYPEARKTPLMGSRPYDP